MTSLRATTSNQRWNSVVYVNIGIYNVKQRWINILFLNIDIEERWQRQNNAVIFNVKFHNVGQL